MPNVFKNGFTLVELLVAISISALLVTVGMAGFREFSNRQQIDTEVRTVLSDLRSIQTTVSSGVKPSPAGGGGCTGTLSGYQVTFIGNAAGCGGGSTHATQYRIDAMCPTAVNVKTVTLPTNHSICVNRTPNNAHFLFKSVQGGTDISSITPIILTLSSTKTSRTAQITITSAGKIQ